MTPLFAPHPHVILMIGDDGIVTVPHNIPNTVPFFTPLDSKNGMQEIVDFVTRNPMAQITLFTDSLAQDYRSDTIPRLNIIDRAKLVQRRLKQTFPSARLTASLNLKQAHQFLLIGLHESNPVFSWAERLRARMPTLVLLPVEGARLVVRLMPESTKGWAMMISRHKTGGFRQIVTRNGDLIFTRLTPLPQNNDYADADIIARDIKASLDYLGRHGLRDASALAVLLLLPDEIHTAACFNALPLKSITSLSPFAAAEKLGLPFAPQPHDDAGDLFFAASLVTHRPLLSLMLPETRHTWRNQILRQWGMRVACIAMLLAVTHMIWSASTLASTLLENEKQTVQLAETHHSLEQAQINAAPLTEPLGRLRQAVERRRVYDQPVPMPWQGLNELAAGIHSDAKIVKLNWRKESDTTPETFTVGLHVMPQTPDNDRAATVAAFTQTTQNIAHAMPDYAVTVTRTPFPDMPQDSVTAMASSADPIGEISLQRKMP